MPRASRNFPRRSTAVADKRGVFPSAMGLVACPECNRLNDIDARLCDQCGTAVPGAPAVDVPSDDDDEAGRNNKEDVAVTIPVPETATVADRADGDLTEPQGAGPAGAGSTVGQPGGGDGSGGYKPKSYHKDSEDALTCGQCSRGNAEDAKYCDQCGAAFPSPYMSYVQAPDENVRCPTCMCMNDDDAEYCDQCGKVLTGRADVIVQASSRPRRGDLAPRENLVRGVLPMWVRRDGSGTMPVLEGHFAVFNRWTHIESFWEGDFMEQIAPTAFDKTFKDNRSSMRCLFQHGMDFQIGDKPLGPITDLRSDDIGAYYRVPLLDTSYNDDLIPGLDAGLYGASFRFRVVREDFNKRPERTAFNPDGLPERTVEEAEVMEFGPVTFPAYADATAGLARSRDDVRMYIVRSLTDQYIEFRLRGMVGDPERIKQFQQTMERQQRSTPAPAEQAVDEHLSQPRRITVVSRRPVSVDDFVTALQE